MLTCCHTLLLCPGIKATFKFSVSLSDQVTLGESLDPSPGQRSLLFNGQAGRTSPGVCELCAWAPSPRPCRRSLGRTRTWERRPSARLSPGARKSAPQEDEEVPGPTLMPWPWPCLGNRKVGEGWGRGEHCFLAWEGELVG